MLKNIYGITTINGEKYETCFREDGVLFINRKTQGNMLLPYNMTMKEVKEIMKFHFTK